MAVMTSLRTERDEMGKRVKGRKEQQWEDTGEEKKTAVMGPRQYRNKVGLHHPYLTVVVLKPPLKHMEI